MEEDKRNSPGSEAKEKSLGDAHRKQESQEAAEHAKSGGGGWGGWSGFSAFSVLSDLQKAAEEISRNAAAVAEKAAKTITDNVVDAGDSEEDSSKGEGREGEGSGSDKEEPEDENDKLRKSALEKLESAGSDSLLGQGLKVLDSSVENLATEAWQVFGNAWKGGSSFVQKSAVNLAESIQHGSLPGAAGSGAPSLLEAGKAFTAKGMEVLEYVGKETIDLLISETGIEIDKASKGTGHEGGEDQLLEELTFDRCFYIYGGPEQLEELEALSNHYALLFNRRKAKLQAEQKSLCDGELKLIQQMLNLTTVTDGESNKGKEIETETEGSRVEIKSLYETGVKKAADLAAGFTSALAGLTTNEIIQRSASRIETLHSDGVHRLSEMCCSAVSQLLVHGKSLISNANKTQEDNADKDLADIKWPDDSVEKARLIRTKALSMTGYLEVVLDSFITGISDVAEAYSAAMKNATCGSHEDVLRAPVLEKVKALSELLRSDGKTAVSKIQEGLEYLSYVVISASMPTA